MKRSYVFIGAGGVGGYYGMALARAGHPVAWLVRSGAAGIRRRGFEVETRGTTWRLDSPAVFDDPRELPAADVVAVTIKTTGNDGLLRILPAILRKPGVPLVMMQNGLGPEETAAAAAPGHPIFGGLCFLCSIRLAPGRIRHLDYGKVTFAAHDPTGRPAGLPAAMRGIAEDFAATGIETELLPDLVEARWRKLMWNIPFSGLCVVLGTDTRTLVQTPATRTLAADLMSEVRAGARALGRDIPPSFADHMFELTDRMTPYAPSMKLDHEAGRPMEIEAIYERPAAVARAAGTPMSRVETLARMLRFLEGRLPAPRGSARSAASEDEDPPGT